MTHPVEPHLPKIRQLALRYAASGIDSVDAFVSEGALAAMQRLPSYDPTRGASEWSYLYPWVQDALRCHAKDMAGRGRKGRRLAPVSIHALTSTELLSEWRSEPVAEDAVVAKQADRRAKRRLRGFRERRECSPMQRDILRGGHNGAELARQHGVTKQAASAQRQSLQRKLKGYLRDVADERKTVRVCLAISCHDAHNAKKVGEPLTRLVAMAAAEPVTASGTSLLDMVRVGTRVPPDVYHRLCAAADATGRSRSHLVRAKLRELVAHSTGVQRHRA